MNHVVHSDTTANNNLHRGLAAVIEMVTRPRVTRKVMGVPLAHSDFPDLWFGGFTTGRFHGLGRAVDHPIIYRGQIDERGRFTEPDQPVLFRVDSGCITGGVFHDENCDCPWQLRMAMQALSDLPSGVPGLIIHHLHHEGKAQGWVKKLRSYEPFEDAEGGHFPVSDKRRFRSTIAILRSLGVRRVVSMTNNPQKLEALRRGNIEVVEVINLVTDDPRMRRYLEFKRTEYGHQLDGIGGEA